MKTEENKRMLALSYIVADLKAENIELAQRMHQLADDYNDVARQLNGKETHRDDDIEGLLLRDMQKMRDHCDKLEKDNEQLKRQCVQLQIERNEAKTHAEQCDIIQKEMRDHCDKLEKENRELERFAKAIHSFVKDKNLYMAKGANCQYYKDGPHVCSTFCLECKSCLGVIDGVGVICANKLVEARVSFPNND